MSTPRPPARPAAPAPAAVTVSAGGWLVVAMVVLGIGGGLLLGWLELVALGAVALGVAVAAGLFIVGRTSGRVEIAVVDRHVVAGGTAVVAVRAFNDSGSRIRARTVELTVRPVSGSTSAPGGAGSSFTSASSGAAGSSFASAPGGGAGASFTRLIELPAVPRGVTREVEVLVPALRRGIIALGPVVVVRRDPLGLARRESVLSGTGELYVHPATVPLAVRSTGLLRDLEGTPTSDLTDSDMSFHALRPYVPGDDRRHIHWKSTARAGAFLVRQFEQTRRSHLIVVQSQAPEDYASAEEFELAVSVVASIGVRAIADGATVSVYAGGARGPVPTPAATAGAFARSTRGGSPRNGITSAYGATAADGAKSTRAATASGGAPSGTEARIGARFGGKERAARSGGRLRTRAPRDLLDDLSGVEELSGAPRLTALARSVGEAASDASVVFLACGSPVTARQVRAAASHFPTGVEVIAVVAEPESPPALVRIDALRITRIGYLDDLARTLTRAAGT
ncbi:DUF58 domain-containing protein [Herbiconiux liukaitaii]|uniref:DUF58 domain-containing protein n=1 Tax=Herbiconiux liukaitaii TaxID=3342799 RepID=UPI0035BA7F79